MYRKRKRIEKLISLVLSVLILLMSVGCSNTAPDASVSSPNEEIITETTEKETVITEKVIEEEILVEHITEEVYLNEIVEVENKITELLLEEETISEVLQCNTVYVAQNNIEEFSKNSQTSKLFGDGINLSSVLTKMSVGTGVIVTLVVLKKKGFSNPIASVIAAAADKSLKYAVLGGAIGSLFGGLTGATDEIDVSKRTTAVISVATAFAGLVITAVSLAGLVFSDGGTAATGLKGVHLIVSGLETLLALGGTVQAGIHAVKTFQSTDCFDINWNNIEWSKLGVSAAEKAIDNGTSGIVCGSLVGAVHGGIEGYEFYHKYHTPYTEYNKRIAQTPKDGDGGHWIGNRGESEYVLDKPIKLPDGTKITKVKYQNGVPDFSPYAKAEVKIPKMTNNRYTSGGNYEQADKALAQQWTKTKYQNKTWTSSDVKSFRENYPCKLTWHEMSNMDTMQLVPYEVNSTFGHCGGVAEYNAMLQQNGVDAFD